jgi:ComF family protein
MTRSLPREGDVLVPLPLHRRRLRERGYNQSALLAAELSRLTGIELSEGALVRRTATAPQAKTASLAERRTNIAGAFARGDDRLRGRRVLLVDDVTTSGATLEAGAEALRESGAESVWGLVLAREV